MSRASLYARWLLVAVTLFPATASGTNDTVYVAGTLSDEMTIVEPTANPGETATVGFFYIDPTSNIQGYTLAVCFDCTLSGIPGSFSIEESLLSVIGAEFISEQVDNDPGDGDGCELVIGILLDAAPPFEGQTMPPTLIPLLIGTYQFFVPPDVPCFTCFPVEFCDGINGTGGVPISNVVVIENQSVAPVAMVSTNVCVPADSLFVRGDSNDDAEIDVADVIWTMNFLFDDGPAPVCLDAADTNDDGLLNISDPVFLALYIFLDGLAPLPPFPNCGLDPNPDLDELGCEGPTQACPFCP